jgi:NADPH-dependent glutamate synthase beta subunit-like oxidoreductase
VTVYEAKEKIGGVLRYGVPSFRLPEDFLENELKDLETLKIDFKCSTPIKGKAAIAKLLNSGYKAVFLGTGLWKATALESPRPSGVFSSIDFLEDFRTRPRKAISRQVSNKTVGIIGGGSVAIDCARVALELGARDVYLIYRRSYAQMPAEPDERIEALSEGVHFLLLNQPITYIADEKNHLVAVKLRRTSLGEPDRSGRRSPVSIKDSDWELKLDVLVEAIGNLSHENMADLLPQAKESGNNLIQVNDSSYETGLSGVFAGGDIVRGPGLIVEAIKDGKAAGNAIIERLLRGNSR